MERIVLFDGVCNFCNGAVNFMIARDHEHKFKFAALQSDIGKDLQAKYNIPSDVDSIVLIENEAAVMHSTAALQITRVLGGVWLLLYAFVIVPTPIRDWFYKLFAKYRYRLFGKKDVCMVPTPDVKERFLSEPPA